MPRRKTISEAEERRRAGHRKALRRARQDELLYFRLEAARRKHEAAERAEKTRKRDEYLDEIYCGELRAMIERVEYQERMLALSTEHWNRGRACDFRFDKVDPRHDALLAHYNLATSETLRQDELKIQEKLRRRRRLTHEAAKTKAAPRDAVDEEGKDEPAPPL